MSYKINILILSNQISHFEGVGNPIIYNYIKALEQEDNLKVYFKSIKTLVDIKSIRNFIKTKSIDVVHIHFGGLNSFLTLCFIGNLVPRILTFHGTDIHGGGSLKQSGFKKFLKNRINKFFSLLSLRKLNLVGIVSEDLSNYLPYYVNYFVDKLGVDESTFDPLKFSETECREKLGLDSNKKYFLFSSVSSSVIKRPDLAHEIIQNFNSNYEILFVTNVKSENVPYYLGACDYVLITSDKEGSPNIVREALMMNKIVFSVDCGDVKEQIKYSKYSIIISRDPKVAYQQINDQINLIAGRKSKDRNKYFKKISWKYLRKEKVKIYSNIKK